MAETAETFVIWNRSRGVYWRPDRQGYTQDVEEAGDYSLEEAADISFWHVPAGELVVIPSSRKRIPHSVPEEAAHG